MLDLGFVRTNLEVVEEKLRARGADPAALLGDFRALDQSRREAITTSEQLKARRNELSQQVGALKKAGQDATAVMDETRALKDELDELDQAAAGWTSRCGCRWRSIPNLTRDEVPAGTSEADNVTVKTWGEKRVFDFEPKPHWEMGEGARDSGPGTGGEAERGAVCRLHGRGGAAGAGADQLHARPAHAEARIYRSAAAVHGELEVAVRDRAVAQVCRGPVPLLGRGCRGCRAGRVQGQRPLADSDGRSAGDQSLPRRDS